MSDKVWNIEVLNNDIELGKFKAAIFDFDGTISLIREGWRQIMVLYFIEEFMLTSPARGMRLLRVSYPLYAAGPDLLMPPSLET